MASNNAAVALLKQGLTTEALNALEALIHECPDYWAAHFNRGNALKDLRRWEDAIASYDRALELASKPPWLGILPMSIVSQIRCNRGGAFLDFGMLQSAHEAFESALEADSSNMVARINLESMQRSFDKWIQADDGLTPPSKKMREFTGLSAAMPMLAIKGMVIWTCIGLVGIWGIGGWLFPTSTSTLPGTVYQNISINGLWKGLVGLTLTGGFMGCVYAVLLRIFVRQVGNERMVTGLDRVAGRSQTAAEVFAFNWMLGIGAISGGLGFAFAYPELPGAIWLLIGGGIMGLIGGATIPMMTTKIVDKYI